MSKFEVKEQILSVQTVEEHDALLEKYKLQNPAKYAAKLASGEFDRVRASLGGAKEVKKAPEKEVKKSKE